jgi:uncharacterized phage-like protein YoqJ
MKLMVTGHRREKLEANSYCLDFIKASLLDVVNELHKEHHVHMGFSGMASGVDLWFCNVLGIFSIPLTACVPFEGQEKYMPPDDQHLRQMHLERAKIVRNVKNSWMVEHCDWSVVVWSGAKGGTHNVVEQLVEKSKPFVWINPVGEKIWKCV